MIYHETKKRQPIFYGWFVVAAGFAVTLTLGETFWSFGVFFKPLEDEFGWSRSLVSSSYTAFLIGYAISAIASGRLADRYNPRGILLATAVLAGLGIALCSQVESINQLRIFIFIAGLGAGATWSVPASSVQRWFHNRPRAGLALSIVSAGVGIGAIIFAPLINSLILNHGWRNAYLTVGIIFFVILALSALVIRPSPVEAETIADAEESTSKSAGTQGWTTSQILRTPSFIGVTLIICVGSLSFNTISVHLIPRATDVGISPTIAAAALGLMGGSSVPGRLLSGLISDRIGWQKTLALSLLGMALALLWLLLLRSTWMLYCFVFSYGICHGLRMPAQVGILGRLFGMRSLGEIIGISTAISQLVGSFAPYMAGFIFDMTASYSIAFIIVMALLLAASLVTSIIKEPSMAPK